MKPGIFFAIAALLAANSANAEAVIHRYVNFTLGAASISERNTSGQVYAEFASGDSESFLPVRPGYHDRLIIHIKFVDSTVGASSSGYRRQYLVLRDLGRGLFNQKGWQSFRSSLSLDSGSVSAQYNPGWTFPVSNPTQYSLWASPTRTVNGAGPAEASLSFNLTDATIAIHELTVEYNFSFDPPAITEGAGFDRISLVIQADDIKILEMPVASLAYGPRSATGGAFDFDMDGLPDRGTISATTNESQHYMFRVYAERGSIIDQSEFAIFDVLGPAFELDPSGEQTDIGCVDGLCDGIASGNDCSAVIGAQSGKGRGKNASPSGTFLLQVGETANNGCSWNVYAKTDPKSAANLCEAVSTSIGETVLDAITLNTGSKVFDRVSTGLLEGQPSIWLRPIGCL